MDSNQTSELSFDSVRSRPLDLVRRPRLGLFLAGALSVSISLTLIGFQVFDPPRSALHDRDGWFLCAVFGIPGVIACLYSMMSELRHVHQTSISGNGLVVTWSQVPHFSSERRLRVDSFGWNEFDAIAWYESESLVSLKQKILFQFRGQNSLDESFVEVSLGNDRDILLGRQLSKVLPPTTAFPDWVRQLNERA